MTNVGVALGLGRAGGKGVLKLKESVLVSFLLLLCLKDLSRTILEEESFI